mgnify:CR=1 FL=1
MYPLQLIKIILSVIIVIILSYLLPWWIISIIALIIGYTSNNVTEAIICGFIIGFLSWFIVLIYMFNDGGDIIFTRMSLLLKMKTPILLIFFSSILSGVLGLLGSWTGWQFKKRG